MGYSDAAARTRSFSSMKTESHEPERTTLTARDRRRVVALARTLTTAVFARMCGVHPQTIGRLAAGLPGHRSTVAFVERRLAELAAVGEAR